MVILRDEEDFSVWRKSSDDKFLVSTLSNDLGAFGMGWKFSGEKGGGLLIFCVMLPFWDGLPFETNAVLLSIIWLVGSGCFQIGVICAKEVRNW